MNILKRLHNPKVHPLSIKAVKQTEEILKTHGMENVSDRAKCSLSLFQNTIRHVKEISVAMQSDGDMDTLLKKHADEQKEVIKKFIPLEDSECEEIVLKYLELIGNIMG